ncbi:unnamed protein product [Toxocara canis]|uniref:Phage protein n=1 Tax=Toxocara canis TaxID=6265 RepID=A0A183UVP9_TOXCA|nr:unnamed protein product [Toxocara canis]
MNLQKPVSDFASALLEANEYEAHHFGFSPKAFTDTVFNIVLETWNDVVNDVLYPALDYTVQYSFRIPNNVTLPEDRCNVLVNDNIDEEEEIESRIEQLKDDITNIRVAIKVVEDETVLTERILKILKELGNDVLPETGDIRADEV